MNVSNYDWIVVGGGISGIAVAEILCREDKSVLLMHDFFPISPSYNLLDENSEIRDTWAIDFSSNVHQFKDKDGLLISNLVDCSMPPL